MRGRCKKAAHLKQAFENASNGHPTEKKNGIWAFGKLGKYPILIVPERVTLTGNAGKRKRFVSQRATPPY